MLSSSSFSHFFVCFHVLKKMEKEKKKKKKIERKKNQD